MNKLIKLQSAARPWVQPVLSANGTLGGDSFACYSNQEAFGIYLAWYALNGNTGDWWGSGLSPTHYIFYNPIPIMVSRLTIYTGDNNGGAYSVILSGSNDNVEYTTLTTYTVSSHGATTEVAIPADKQGMYKYYKQDMTMLEGGTVYFEISNMVITAISAQ